MFRTDIDFGALIRQQELRREADQRRLVQARRAVAKTIERLPRTIAPTPRYAG